MLTPEEKVLRNREATARWRARNPGVGKERRYDWQKAHPEFYRERYAKRRQFLNEQKTKPCADCGNSYAPHIMDFDHVRGKKRGDMGNLLQLSIKSILEEIAKCDLVCANCHRERTFQRGQYTWPRRQYSREL